MDKKLLNLMTLKLKNRNFINEKSYLDKRH